MNTNRSRSNSRACLSIIFHKVSTKQRCTWNCFLNIPTSSLLPPFPPPPSPHLSTRTCRPAVRTTRCVIESWTCNSTLGLASPPSVPTLPPPPPPHTPSQPTTPPPSVSIIITTISATTTPPPPPPHSPTRISFAPSVLVARTVSPTSGAGLWMRRLSRDTYRPLTWPPSRLVPLLTSAGPSGSGLTVMDGQATLPARHVPRKPKTGPDLSLCWI